MITRPIWDALEKVSTIAVIVAAVVVVSTQFWRRTTRHEVRAPKSPVAVNDAAELGRPSAPVVMIVYSDFQCPACRKFVTTTWPKLVERYVQPGRLLITFRNFPLPIHDSAVAAALAAECARRQGKFWQMHDRLFQDPSRLSDTDLSKYAGDLGLDVARWHACQSGEGSVRVKSDTESAKRLGIDGTPMFLIGTRQADGLVKVRTVINGARSFDSFGAAIDELLRSP